MTRTVISNQSGYDLWSQTYDHTRNSTVAVDELRFPGLWSHVRKKRVLEIGCGTGRHTGRLVAQGNVVTGIDLSGGMLEQLKAKFAGAQDLRLVLGDILEMEADQLTAGQPFEVVLSALVLEHILDLDLFFEKVSRLMVSGGRVYISEIHPVRAQAGRLAHFRPVSSEHDLWFESVIHPDGYLDNCARNAGFNVVRRLDALGDHDLEKMEPLWNKYRDLPMVRMWELERL